MDRRLLDGDQALGHRPPPTTYQYGEPAPLNLRRPIFLSHGGKDKVFVRFLHHELRKRYAPYADIAFFDVESLPTGVPVSMENILMEARQSKLGVLVLTEDFFVQTPNPMRELAEFVAHEVCLLPLFFTMSVDEFREKKKSAVWEEEWKKWSGVDERVMNEWRDALNYVLRFSGLEYCKVATNHPDYIRQIVNKVTGIIPPAIEFSEKGVIGMDRLCEIVNGMYKKICSASERSPNHCASTSTSSFSSSTSGLTCSMVGMYGFAGLGKTTLCKGLCDFYFAQFNGKVCYVDLGSKLFDQASSQTHSSSAFRKRVQHMLGTLTSYEGDHQHLEFSQVQNLLRDLIRSQTDPVFLAIDNVLPDLDSKEEADFYLNCGPFPRGSKIFITARSRNILEDLAKYNCSYSMVIEHIPKLEFKEAKDIFTTCKLCNFGSPNVEDEVNECVNVCIISTPAEDHRQYWDRRRDRLYYHPLMLKSLATSIRWDRAGDLKRKLVELQSKKGLGADEDAWKTVYDVLDITYNDLGELSKIVFLDLALFYSVADPRKVDEWIQSVYPDFGRQKIDGILSHLQDLTFINISMYEDKNKVKVVGDLRIHDLLLDFSKYKVSQGIFPRYQGIPHKYVVLEKVQAARWNDQRRSIRSVTISRCGFDNRKLNLTNVGGVEVLQLVDNAGLQQVLLSSSTCVNLRSLIVRATTGTSLRCTIINMVNDFFDEDDASSCLKWVELEGNVIINTRRRPCGFMSSNLHSQYSLPSSTLQNLELTAEPVFDLGALGGLRALEFLTLRDLPSVQSIDVSSCAKLKSCSIWNSPSLRYMHGLQGSTNLKRLRIEDCEELLELTVPAANYGLQSTIVGCGSLENLTLILTTSTSPAAAIICTPEGDQPSLQLYRCSNLTNIDGLDQYTGQGIYFYLQGKNNLLEAFRDLLDSADVDSSFIWKARVMQLELNTHFERSRAAGLGGVCRMELEDAQHFGPLISALFKAQPAHLFKLRIRCKEGGDCGCDKNAPLFGPLPTDADYCDSPSLTYCCSQVRDLSSLSHWHQLTKLDLSGCTSVERWPDFAIMTSLKFLNLSFCTSFRDLNLSGWPASCMKFLNLSFCTSLREWPAGLLLLPCMEKLEMRGCTQLSAEKFMKVITLKMPPSSIACIRGLIKSLTEDVEAQRRERCSIVDALDSQLPELVAGFHDAWHTPAKKSCIEDEWDAVEDYNPHFVLIELMYVACFEDRNNLSDDCQLVLEPMRGLLCNIGWYEASRWYNNEANSDLKDRTIKLVKSLFEAPTFSTQFRCRRIRRLRIPNSNLEWPEGWRYEMLMMYVANFVYDGAGMVLAAATRENSIVDIRPRGVGSVDLYINNVHWCGIGFQYTLTRLQQDYDIYKARFLTL